MKHYTVPGVVKSLAISLVAQMSHNGVIQVPNRRAFRDAVVRVAHTAYLEAA